jgi:hypothetical protein
LKGSQDSKIYRYDSCQLETVLPNHNSNYITLLLAEKKVSPKAKVNAKARIIITSTRIYSQISTSHKNILIEKKKRETTTMDIGGENKEIYIKVGDC